MNPIAILLYIMAPFFEWLIAAVPPVGVVLFVVWCAWKFFSWMKGNFDEIRMNFKDIDAKFKDVDARFKDVDANFKSMDAKMDLRFAEVTSDIKREIVCVKSELKNDIAEVKAELKSDIAEVRTELAAVKSELKSDIAEVRTDIQRDIPKVKSDLKEDITDIRSELRNVNTRLDQHDIRISHLETDVKTLVEGQHNLKVQFVRLETKVDTQTEITMKILSFLHGDQKTPAITLLKGHK